MKIEANWIFRVSNYKLEPMKLLVILLFKKKLTRFIMQGENYSF